MTKARPLRKVVVALCVILAVAGCEGPPPGAKETVQRLAALDIVTSPPPQGVLLAKAEDLGHAGAVVAWDPSVTVVYATTASIDDLRNFFVSAFPGYGIAERCCMPAGLTALEGHDADAHVEITISRDAPHYVGYNSPPPGPAPEGTNVYVVVEVLPRPVT